MDSDPRAPVVVLAGGTGGAKLARGMLDVAGDDLVVIANTGDDVEHLRRARLPRPRPRARSGWPTASTSAAGACDGDTFDVMDGAARARRRRRGSTSATATSPTACAAPSCWPAAPALTEALAELTAALGVRARVLPMADEPVRTSVRVGRALGAVPGVHDPRARGRARSTTSRYDGVEARRRRPRPSGRDRRRARRSSSGRSQPHHLDPADPRRARDRARRCAPRPRRSSRSRRSSAGRSLKGPTEPFLAWAGVAPERRRRRARYYGDLLDGLVADEARRGLGLPLLETDTLMADAAARARVAAEVLALRARGADAGDRARTVAVLPVKRFARRQAAAGRRPVGRARRRALAEAMVTDVLIALRRGRSASTTSSWSPASTPPSRWPPATTPPRSSTTPRTPATARPPSAASRAALERGATRVAARARRLPGARPGRARRPARASRAGRPRSSIVPDRHGTGHQRAAADAARRSIAPGLRRRARASATSALAREAGAAVRVVDVPTLGLDVDTLDDLDALRAALERLRGGAVAHARAARRARPP